MSNTPASLKPSQDGYADWLRDLKTHNHCALQHAALAVNLLEPAVLADRAQLSGAAGRAGLGCEGDRAADTRLDKLPAAGMRPNARRIAYRI